MTKEYVLINSYSLLCQNNIQNNQVFYLENNPQCLEDRGLADRKSS